MKQVKTLERLDKILANSGFGSRKDVRHLIRSKVVSVNGQIVTDFDAHINVNEDQIAVNSVSLSIKENIYIMMNKAAGYVCSTRGGMHPTVYDLLGEECQKKYLGGDVNTIGRLDLDTEGLLIFTSDGDLNHRLTSPKWNIPKTYFVRLAERVSEKERSYYVSELAKGMHIPAEDKAEAADCLPAECSWGTVSEDGSCNEAYLTVYEGKFHEVKRLFAALGNTVTYLKRVSINKLKLDESLAPGEYKELTDEEIKLLDVQEDVQE